MTLNHHQWHDCQRYRFQLNIIWCMLIVRWCFVMINVCFLSDKSNDKFIRFLTESSRKDTNMTTTYYDEKFLRKVKDGKLHFLLWWVFSIKFINATNNNSLNDNDISEIQHWYNFSIEEGHQYRFFCVKSWRHYWYKYTADKITPIGNKQMRNRQFRHHHHRWANWRWTFC